jgi:hypothetical protein
MDIYQLHTKAILLLYKLAPKRDDRPTHIAKELEKVIFDMR